MLVVIPNQALIPTPHVTLGVSVSSVEIDNMPPPPRILLGIGRSIYS